MTTFLRKPNEDEHLTGVLVDYVLEMGVQQPWSFVKRTLGHKATVIADLPGGLRCLARETQEVWGLEAIDIRGRFTGYPYLVASCSEDVARRVGDAMNRIPSAPTNRCGLGFGRFIRQRAFRYCCACADEDRACGIRPYCRRTHQLPGVMVCHRHACLLNESPVLVEEPFKTAIVTRGICKGGARIDIGEFDPPSMAIIQMVADISSKILSFAEQGQFYGNQKWYRDHLELRGYSLGENLVRLDALSAHVISMFGTGFLAWTGLFRKGQGARDWLVPLLCKGQAVPPTVSHVLLQAFLEVSGESEFLPSTSTNTYLSIECPAAYLPHILSQDDHKILRVRITTGRGSAVCGCGTAFSFSVVDGLGQVDRVRRFGKPYQRCAEYLRENGLTTKEIAREMRLSAMSVGRLLKAAGESSSPSDADAVKRWRTEWRRAFDSDAHYSLKDARRDQRKLYRALLAHDRQWLDEFCRMYRISPRDRVDWVARDAEYSERMKAAANELRRMSPPRCISKISILFIADVKLGTRNQLAKLPKCRRVLEEIVESMQDFRIRIKD